MNNLLFMMMDIEMEQGSLFFSFRIFCFVFIRFRTVFLFDRVLLICKVKVRKENFVLVFCKEYFHFIKGSEKYTFRAALFIQGCQIEELKAAKREVYFEKYQKTNYLCNFSFRLFYVII